MPNRLSASASPYLRQHADNPVDWWEWGNEAFADARRRDVPVLLSVGYSACHWCHVMAHESFEDPATAAVMNEHFVNIKVDREERPDVDAVYMTAVQALTGRGGWPMTVWMDPEGRPFHAGTYFPAEPHHGMPSFLQVMGAVTQAWQQRRSEIDEQAGRLSSMVAQPIPPGSDVPGDEALRAAYADIARLHDPVNGGLGGAPKFPQQPVIDFLLRITGRPWAPKAGAMARQTLERIAAGGIHDHVDGGFARYSVDDRWLVPHFEKMLYDNAQLARLYLRAGQVFGSERFTDVALTTLSYMDRVLGHADGGFQAAEDADSEGEEGRFYVWALDEFREATGDLADYACARFGVTASGNWEGTNVLHHALLPDEAAAEAGISWTPEVEEEVRTRLRARRSQRIRPGLDHKVVTAWNGLTIRAFAEAGAVLDRDDLVDRGAAAARFVLDVMAEDGRLMRSWSEDTTSVPGFLDDHASMALACLGLYEATGDVEWFSRADRIVRDILERFSADDGGFHTTASDAERLIARQKDLMDNPSPSGNSMAAEALLRLGAFTGESALVAAAEGAMRAAALVVDRSPTAVGHLLGAVDFDSRAVEVAITGDAGDLERAVWGAHRPNLVLAVDRTGAGGGVVPLLQGRTRTGPTAWVCEDFACQAPTSDPRELESQLAAVTVTA